jgi:hypothetical protein
LVTGDTNLYKDIAPALKAVEWRKPGLVTFANKLCGKRGAARADPL